MSTAIKLESFKGFIDNIDKLEKEREERIKKEEKDEGGRNFRPFSDYCSHYGVFFDDLGYYVGRVKLDYKERKFYYKDRAFNFKPKESSFFKYATLFRTKKYYFYNINNPDPILIDKKVEPIMDAGVYKTILDSDLVKKLNPKSNNLLDFIGGWKGLILLLVVGAVIYYFASGGSLTK